MQNKNSAKELITPLSALKNLNKSLDNSLIDLDEACEHFQDSVLSTELISAESLDKMKETDKDEILATLESYALLASFLLEHPLLTVIRQIRDESKISDSEAVVMHIKSDIQVGQEYTHYKGTVYQIVSVASNANHPTIDNIHYTSGDGKVWELPAHEFCKRITYNGERVSRFKLVTA